MSRSINQTLTCPCGQVFDSAIYDYVNVAKDPQLQYTVLAGLLNVSTCPSCGRRAAISRPFIYSDPMHNLLAFVHPRNDAPEEARLLILEKLRNVYMSVVGENEERANSGHTDGGNGNGNVSPAITSDTDLAEEPEIPPLQVIFGLDQLNEVINAVLSQDERLGRLALNTYSRNDAERGQ